MKRSILTGLMATCFLAGIMFLGSQAKAQAVPKSLKGKIITNKAAIDIPGSLKGFVKKLRKQDRTVFTKNDEGQWVIHFVAFFKRSLPAEQIGVVVLDAKKEPVAVANVAGTKGQKTLAAHIIVETTETPNKKHILRVYYPKGNKPIVLAEKKILLK
ncbi:MAG: hypothetical protein JRJ87_05825 [Deltaproteobacteria bacterium]|nr:hypothetical protein [Deltaproteobacteria bacterium]